MKPEDIFPDQMDIGRPESAEAIFFPVAEGGITESGDIVGEGIDPDINAAAGIVKPPCDG